MIDNSRSIIKTRCSELSVDVLPAIERRTVSQHQQLSLADLFRTVARRKTPMLLFAVIVLGLVGAYTFLKTPRYEGVARLQIDPTHPTNLGLDSETDKQATTDVDSRIKTEVTIIQSDTVAMQVMRELRLYADPHFAGKYTVRTPIRNLADLQAGYTFIHRSFQDYLHSGYGIRPTGGTNAAENHAQSWSQ